MFFSSVTMKGRAEKRLEIIQTIGGIRDLVKERKGCLRVATYQDIVDNNTFFLINEWKTKEDMDDYLQSKLFAALLGIRTILAETPDIKILIQDCTYNCNVSDYAQVN